MIGTELADGQNSTDKDYSPELNLDGLRSVIEPVLDGLTHKLDKDTTNAILGGVLTTVYGGFGFLLSLPGLAAATAKDKVGSVSGGFSIFFSLLGIVLSPIAIGADVFASPETAFKVGSFITSISFLGLVTGGVATLYSAIGRLFWRHWNRLKFSSNCMVCNYKLERNILKEEVI